MRYLAPALCLLGTPALAHPSAIPHAHGPDWTLIAAAAIVGTVTAIALYRRAARAGLRR